MPKAIVYETDGRVFDIKPNNNKSFTYEEMKGIVGGMVEIVPLPSGRSLICNEEGKLDGLPENIEATKIWKEEYPIAKYPLNNDELIVGNVLITDPEFLEEEEEDESEFCRECGRAIKNDITNPLCLCDDCYKEREKK
jgi:hypothetical protein